MQLQHNGDTRVSRRGLMPPYFVLHDFLDEATVTSLLAYTVSHQSDFAPTQVRTGLNPTARLSKGLRKLGGYREILTDKILGLVPRLVAELRANPVAAPTVELELVAHGDGAFYKRHIDTQTGPETDIDPVRVLSGVYYFNSQPKTFTGGALRLYAIGGEGRADIEPVHNSLLVFPSWAPHDVMPVQCPSKRFIDSRFAINCWVRRGGKHDVRI
jgi:SM-20-related protein